MAITDKEKGVWGLDQVYNKINQGSIWDYSSTLNGLFVWGDNDKGQLGQNQGPAQLARVSSPVQVGSDTTWSALVATTVSSSITGAMKTDGTLWLWGRGKYGTLGQNTSIDHSSPVQLPGTTWDSDKITTVNRSLMAIKTNGTLWGVGSNQYGNLGQNSRTAAPGGYSSPVQCPGTTWKTVAGLYLGTIATKTDGTLWTMGYSGYNGQLGQNNSENYSSPVQIPGTTWDKVSHSGTAAGAIKTDGTLWAWGDNGYGRLGVNDTVQRSSPIQVGTDTTWQSMVLNSQFSLAQKTDGTLWSWGTNEWGQLGQNTRSATGISSPAQIPGTDWATGKYAASMNGGAALRTDGTLWSWGYNNFGGVGLNNRTHYSSPTQIPGTWGQVEGGWYNTVGLKLQ